jgi:antitoxin (DNA-binding transcriptional repressor) of toxin-antitoxin stability system
MSLHPATYWRNVVGGVDEDEVALVQLNCTISVKQLNVSEFREQCLALLDELPPEGVLITKRGQPVARLVPVRNNDADLIGSMAGQLKIKGDIFSTGEPWDAES